MKKFICLLIMGLFLIPNVASARNWYVSASGTGDGLTSGAPTQDLVAVAAALAVGDNVYLNGGDVFVSSSANSGPSFSVDNVTLTSYGSGQAILSNDTSYTCLVVNGGNNLEINNVAFHFEGASAQVRYCIGVYLATASVKVKNCFFQKISGDNYQSKGIIGDMGFNKGGDCQNWVVENNNILDFARRRPQWSGYLDHRCFILSLGYYNFDGFIFSDNIISNYEGIVDSRNTGSPNYRYLFVSNTFFNCMGGNSENRAEVIEDHIMFNRGTYEGASYDIRWNTFYNNTNHPAPSFTLYSPDDHLKVLNCENYNLPNLNTLWNNTFFGFASICDISSLDTSSTNWFVNNIIVRAPNQVVVPVYSGADTTPPDNTHGYTMWWGQSALTNANFSIYLGGATNADPDFVSLDPSNPTFMQPSNPAIVNGYDGGFIGSKAIPEPAMFFITGLVILLVRFKK